MHYGASNEIKEIEICKKCPKAKPILLAHLWSNYGQTFFGWCKITKILYQICFFVKTVEYWVYFFDLSGKDHERLVR